jgi:outer membrane protein OmpA-like peptidoglycan-associated protein
MRLSEARAATVRDWMAAEGLIPAETPDQGASANRSPLLRIPLPTAKDDPEGRQKNRRVEVVFDTCR